MIRLQFRKSWRGYRTGQFAEIDRDVAHMLCERGIAVKIVERAPKDKMLRGRRKKRSKDSLAPVGRGTL